MYKYISWPSEFKFNFKIYSFELVIDTNIKTEDYVTLFYLVVYDRFGIKNNQNQFDIITNISIQ